jgi:hypothetical protein
VLFYTTTLKIDDKMYIIIIGEGMWERQKIESIKQNYCNNRIKKEYSCEVEVREENIVLTEKSKTHIIMGESKDLDIETYKNNLIKKGFKCQNADK